MFERFRAILHEGAIDKRVQYTIEALFAARKSGFKEYPGVPAELDLIDADDQFTHEDINLEEKYDTEETLNYFRFDPQFAEHEEMYAAIKTEILGEADDPGEAEAQVNCNRTYLESFSFCDFRM